MQLTVTCAKFLATPIFHDSKYNIANINNTCVRLVGWGLLPAAAAAASSSEQHGTSPPPHQPNTVNVLHNAVSI